MEQEVTDLVNGVDSRFSGRLYNSITSISSRQAIMDVGQGRVCLGLRADADANTSKLPIEQISRDIAGCYMHSLSELTVELSDGRTRV